ncbi:Sult2a7 [Phodopus roborovskii]|uniref:Sulfotransferase n=1 Tax=Phodopus roborovskii TaxID=109678 RepID=A0AAV0ACA9_PHORO|nr:Sult2a7 [Phodopus roborovskii]
MTLVQVVERVSQHREPKRGIVGTNWLVETVSLIQSKGNPECVQSMPVWERSPWIETEIGQKYLISNERPPLLISHLPFHLFPKSFFHSKAKVIYVMRNPRDVLVSGYFFWSKSNLVKNADSLSTYFEWFLKGNVAYGSWFEHIRGWLSMRGSENFLLLSYEDMKKVNLGYTRHYFKRSLRKIILSSFVYFIFT